MSINAKERKPAERMGAGLAQLRNAEIDDFDHSGL
jgi:hypothetical protein